MKTMFMAVVGRPLTYRGFNGKMHMEQVSKTKYISKCTAHTNFSDDAVVNVDIKAMEWKGLVTDECTCSKFINLISNTYQLKEYILDCLEFYINTTVGTQGNRKEISLEFDNIK